MLRFKNVIDTIDGHTAGEPVRLVISIRAAAAKR